MQSAHQPAVASCGYQLQSVSSITCNLIYSIISYSFYIILSFYTFKIKEENESIGFELKAIKQQSESRNKLFRPRKAKSARIPASKMQK